MSQLNVYNLLGGLFSFSGPIGFVDSVHVFAKSSTAVQVYTAYGFNISKLTPSQGQAAPNLRMA